MGTRRVGLTTNSSLAEYIKLKNEEKGTCIDINANTMSLQNGRQPNSNLADRIVKLRHAQLNHKGGKRLSGATRLALPGERTPDSRKGLPSMDDAENDEIPWKQSPQHHFFGISSEDNGSNLQYSRVRKSPQLKKLSSQSDPKQLRRTRPMASPRKTKQQNIQHETISNSRRGRHNTNQSNNADFDVHGNLNQLKSLPSVQQRQGADVSQQGEEKLSSSDFVFNNSSDIQNSESEKIDDVANNEEWEYFGEFQQKEFQSHRNHYDDSAKEAMQLEQFPFFDNEKRLSIFYENSADGSIGCGLSTDDENQISPPATFEAEPQSFEIGQSNDDNILEKDRITEEKRRVATQTAYNLQRAGRLGISERIDVFDPNLESFRDKDAEAIPRRRINRNLSLTSLGTASNVGSLIGYNEGFSGNLGNEADINALRLHTSGNHNTNPFVQNEVNSHARKDPIDRLATNVGNLTSDSQHEETTSELKQQPDKVPFDTIVNSPRPQQTVLSHKEERQLSHSISCGTSHLNDISKMHLSADSYTTIDEHQGFALNIDFDNTRIASTAENAFDASKPTRDVQNMYEQWSPEHKQEQNCFGFNATSMKDPSRKQNNTDDEMTYQQNVSSASEGNRVYMENINWSLHAEANNQPISGSSLQENKGSNFHDAAGFNREEMIYSDWKGIRNMTNPSERGRGNSNSLKKLLSSFPVELNSLEMDLGSPMSQSIIVHSSSSSLKMPRNRDISRAKTKANHNISTNRDQVKVGGNSLDTPNIAPEKSNLSQEAGSNFPAGDILRYDGRMKKQSRKAPDSQISHGVVVKPWEQSRLSSQDINNGGHHAAMVPLAATGGKGKTHSMQKLASSFAPARNDFQLDDGSPMSQSIAFTETTFGSRIGFEPYRLDDSSVRKVESEKSKSINQGDTDGEDHIQALRSSIDPSVKENSFLDSPPGRQKIKRDESLTQTSQDNTHVSQLGVRETVRLNQPISVVDQSISSFAPQHDRKDLGSILFPQAEIMPATPLLYRESPPSDKLRHPIKDPMNAHNSGVELVSSLTQNVKVENVNHCELPIGNKIGRDGHRSASATDPDHARNPSLVSACTGIESYSSQELTTCTRPTGEIQCEIDDQFQNGIVPSIRNARFNIQKARTNETVDAKAKTHIRKANDVALPAPGTVSRLIAAFGTNANRIKTSKKDSVTTGKWERRAVIERSNLSSEKIDSDVRTREIVVPGGSKIAPKSAFHQLEGIWNSEPCKSSRSEDSFDGELPDSNVSLDDLCNANSTVIHSPDDAPCSRQTEYVSNIKQFHTDPELPSVLLRNKIRMERGVPHNVKAIDNSLATKQEQASLLDTDAGSSQFCPFNGHGDLLHSQNNSIVSSWERTAHVSESYSIAIINVSTEEKCPKVPVASLSCASDPMGGPVAYYERVNGQSKPTASGAQMPMNKLTSVSSISKPVLSREQDSVQVYKTSVSPASEPDLSFVRTIVSANEPKPISMTSVCQESALRGDSELKSQTSSDSRAEYPLAFSFSAKNGGGDDGGDNAEASFASAPVSPTKTTIGKLIFSPSSLSKTHCNSATKEIAVQNGTFSDLRTNYRTSPMPPELSSHQFKTQSLASNENKNGLRSHSAADQERCSSYQEDLSEMQDWGIRAQAHGTSKRDVKNIHRSPTVKHSRQGVNILRTRIESDEGQQRGDAYWKDLSSFKAVVESKKAVDTPQGNVKILIVDQSPIRKKTADYLVEFEDVRNPYCEHRDYKSTRDNGSLVYPNDQGVINCYADHSNKGVNENIGSVFSRDDLGTASISAIEEPPRRDNRYDVDQVSRTQFCDINQKCGASGEYTADIHGGRSLPVRYHHITSEQSSVHIDGKLDNTNDSKQRGHLSLPGAMPSIKDAEEDDDSFKVSGGEIREGMTNGLQILSFSTNLPPPLSPTLSKPDPPCLDSCSRQCTPSTSPHVAFNSPSTLNDVNQSESKVIGFPREAHFHDIPLPVTTNGSRLDAPKDAFQYSSTTWTKFATSGTKIPDNLSERMLGWVFNPFDSPTHTEVPDDKAWISDSIFCHATEDAVDFDELRNVFRENFASERNNTSPCLRIDKSASLSKGSPSYETNGVKDEGEFHLGQVESADGCRNHCDLHSKKQLPFFNELDSSLSDRGDQLRIHSDSKNINLHAPESLDHKAMSEKRNHSTGRCAASANVFPVELPDKPDPPHHKKLSNNGTNFKRPDAPASVQFVPLPIHTKREAASDICLERIEILPDGELLLNSDSPCSALRSFEVARECQLKRHDDARLPIPTDDQVKAANSVYNAYHSEHSRSTTTNPVQLHSSVDSIRSGNSDLFLETEKKSHPIEGVSFTDQNTALHEDSTKRIETLTPVEFAAITQSCSTQDTDHKLSLGMHNSASKGDQGVVISENDQGVVISENTTSSQIQSSNLQKQELDSHCEILNSKFESLDTVHSRRNQAINALLIEIWGDSQEVDVVKEQRKGDEQEETQIHANSPIIEQDGSDSMVGYWQIFSGVRAHCSQDQNSLASPSEGIRDGSMTSPDGSISHEIAKVEQLTAFLDGCKGSSQDDDVLATTSPEKHGILLDVSRHSSNSSPNFSRMRCSYQDAGSEHQTSPSKNRKIVCIDNPDAGNLSSISNDDARCLRRPPTPIENDLTLSSKVEPRRRYPILQSPRFRQGSLDHQFDVLGNHKEHIGGDSWPIPEKRSNVARPKSFESTSAINDSDGLVSTPASSKYGASLLSKMNGQGSTRLRRDTEDRVDYDGDIVPDVINKSFDSETALQDEAHRSINFSLERQRRYHQHMVTTCSIDTISTVKSSDRDDTISQSEKEVEETEPTPGYQFQTERERATIRMNPDDYEVLPSAKDFTPIRVNPDDFDGRTIYYDMKSLLSDDPTVHGNEDVKTAASHGDSEAEKDSVPRGFLCCSFTLADALDFTIRACPGR